MLRSALLAARPLAALRVSAAPAAPRRAFFWGSKDGEQGGKTGEEKIPLESAKKSPARPGDAARADAPMYADDAAYLTEKDAAGEDVDETVDAVGGGEAAGQAASDAAAAEAAEASEGDSSGAMDAAALVAQVRAAVHGGGVSGYEAARLLGEMNKQFKAVPPRVSAVRALVRDVRTRAGVDSALRVLAKLRLSGAQLDAPLLAHLVRAAHRAGNKQLAVQLLGPAGAPLGLHATRRATHLAVAGLHGDVALAKHAVALLRRAGGEPDRKIYDSLLSCAAVAGDGEAANMWYAEASAAGVKLGRSALRKVILASYTAAVEKEDAAPVAKETVTGLTAAYESLGAPVAFSSIALAHMNVLAGETAAAASLWAAAPALSTDFDKALHAKAEPLMAVEAEEVDATEVEETEVEAEAEETEAKA